MLLNFDSRKNKNRYTLTPGLTNLAMSRKGLLSPSLWVRSGPYAMSSDPQGTLGVCGEPHGSQPCILSWVHRQCKALSWHIGAVQGPQTLITVSGSGKGQCRAPGAWAPYMEPGRTGTGPQSSIYAHGTGQRQQRAPTG